MNNGMHDNFVILGASNHAKHDRELNDFYATDPNSLEIFLNALERDNFKLHQNIWECACGMGHLSEVLKNRGYKVKSTDLIDRGYGIGNIDFLKSPPNSWDGDILTNPPYKLAKEFVEQALSVGKNGCYIIMFLKIQFLEGKARRKLFSNYPPKYIYVNSERQTAYIKGDMSIKKGSAVCYCWFIWEKGFKGAPIIKWI